MTHTQIETAEIAVVVGLVGSVVWNVALGVYRYFAGFGDRKLRKLEITTTAETARVTVLSDAEKARNALESDTLKAAQERLDKGTATLFSQYETRLDGLEATVDQLQKDVTYEREGRQNAERSLWGEQERSEQLSQQLLDAKNQLIKLAKIKQVADADCTKTIAALEKRINTLQGQVEMLESQVRERGQEQTVHAVVIPTVAEMAIENRASLQHLSDDLKSQGVLHQEEEEHKP